MKKLISILLAISLITFAFCGCKKEESAKKEQPKEEGLTVTFNDESGNPIPQQTQPVEALNKAVENNGFSFKGDHYGVAVNKASADSIKASKVDSFDVGSGETIAIIPFYPGSKVLVEAVTLDMETTNIIPTQILYEATTTDDYVLLVKVDRPDGVIPQLRVSVEYGGSIYSQLIKNIPDAQIEYIR